MDYPKISLVTPSFNQGQFLEQTLDSVLSQGYPNLEYFVVDGGSTDNSREIIEKYSKHIDWWVSEKDNGQSHAINKGLKKATGDIVNWINSDDYYEPNALFTVAAKFMETGASMISFRANVFGLQNRISRGTDLFKDNLPKTLAYTRIDQPETFFSKSAFQGMGLLNENLHYCMDKEWFLRYLLLYGQGHAINSDEVILNFRYHNDSKSVSQQTGFEFESDLIYLSYAEAAKSLKGLEALKYLVGQNTGNRIKTIDSTIFTEKGLAMTNYYLYKRFLEKYESLELKTAQHLFKSIDQDQLQKEDKRILKKLMFRANVLPPSFLKLLRNLTR